MKTELRLGNHTLVYNSITGTVDIVDNYSHVTREKISVDAQRKVLEFFQDALKCGWGS